MPTSIASLIPKSILSVLICAHFVIFGEAAPAGSNEGLIFSAAVEEGAGTQTEDRLSGQNGRIRGAVWTPGREFAPLTFLATTSRQFPT